MTPAGPPPTTQQVVSMLRFGMNDDLVEMIGRCQHTAAIRLRALCQDTTSVVPMPIPWFIVESATFWSQHDFVRANSRSALCARTSQVAEKLDMTSRSG